MKKPSMVLISLMLLMVVVVGCGQKGGLYFPESSAEAVPKNFIAGVKNGLF